MYITAKNNAAGSIIAKCLSISLIVALCVLDAPLSFAGFSSISKTSFNASVTVGGGGGGDPYPEKPDFYEIAYPYVKYFLDRALDGMPQVDYAFNGFTKSFQRYLGGGSPACEDIIISGASSYDQSVFGRILLFSGSTTILDTYIDYYYQLLDPSNPLLKCSNGYTDGNGDPILYGPYRIIRIANRDVPDWWYNWDWIVDTGAAAALAMYAAEAYDKTQNEAYRDFAILLGGYMLRLQDTDGGLRYGPKGMHHDSGESFFWDMKSTEQNQRALYAFEALYRMTEDSLYQNAADNIKSWLKSMYDFGVHLFHSAASYDNGSWHKSGFGYVATDVTALAPLNMMFNDAFFGITQQQRDHEVDGMFLAIEARAAFFGPGNKPIFFRFSISQEGNYGSVEFSSQMALAYLRVAQIYHERENDEKAAEYLDKYNTLVESLETFFTVPDDDTASKIAPYASYLDGSVAGNVPTGTGYDTFNCEAALASAYYVFAKTGYMPYVYDGGSGIPQIVDIHDMSDDYYSYDAHEMCEDGFTKYEKYILYVNGADIFDNSIGLILSASVSSGEAPLDITFTSSVSGNNDIVKYEWDFDGNGTYDRWQYASKGSTVKYKYTASGNYNVRVRVTDTLGRIDTATTTINVSKSASAPTAWISGDLYVYPVLNEFMIPTLQYLRGSGAASVSREIVRYQWDTTGNGEYDILSTKSADATKTFNETISRAFTGALKVTDSQGISDIAHVSVMANATSWDGSPHRPTVYLNNNVIYGTSGANVSLRGFGVPAGGNSYGYAKKLEWDFESNGIYDWSSTLESADWTGYADTTYKYGAPGVYKARLKIHTEANVSSYKNVMIIITGGEPAVRARAKVSQNGGGLIAEITSATAPIKARFDHSQSTGPGIGTGDEKYEWDFIGDKRIDYATTDRYAVPVYDYTVPGYYVAMLRVTDSAGRVDTAYIPVFCTYPETYSSAIKMPKEGQVIAGNAVTLVADVFPDDAGVGSVMFQYSADNGSTWTNIGEGVPVMSYARTWDTTLVPDGLYKLRAAVNGINSTEFKVTSLAVDNNAPNPDIYENSNGIHVKRQVVDPSQANFIVLPDGTHIDIPYGALPDNGSLPVVIIEEVVISGASNTVDITITGVSQFLKDITISIPYPDEDNDGIVDGTGIDENTLVLKWYNENTGDWEVLYDSIVYPNENFISAKVNHLTIFGWGIIGGAAALLGGGFESESSMISYCFIATAAYGTPMADEVMALRSFRDNYLMRNTLGREFVWNYYRYSPPVARFISDKPALRKIARFLLKPLVRVAKTLSLAKGV